MSIDELIEDLKWLSDHGHGDEPVFTYDRYGGEINVDGFREHDGEIWIW